MPADERTQTIADIAAAAIKADTKKKPGRPKGAKTADRAAVISLPPRCPACGSTEREPYRDGPLKEQVIGGAIHGQPYTRIVWRATQCAKCGQALIVREYHNDPA